MRGQARGVDRRERGVADGGVVAVAVTGIQRDDDVGADVLEEGAHGIPDAALVGTDERVRRGVTGHVGVAVVEQLDARDAQQRRGPPQLALAHLGETDWVDAAARGDLAGLSPGRADDRRLHPRVGGVEQHRAGAEGLVVRMGHDDHQAWSLARRAHRVRHVVSVATAGDAGIRRRCSVSSRMGAP